MGRKQNAATETELAILDLLWRQGPQEVREITAALYPDGGRSKIATVRSLLERLEDKGIVRRDRDTYPHRFVAAVNRQDYVGGEIQKIANQMFEGSVAPILIRLVQDTQLDPNDRDRIIEMIEQSESGDTSSTDRSDDDRARDETERDPS